MRCSAWLPLAVATAFMAGILTERFYLKFNQQPISLSSACQEKANSPNAAMDVLDPKSTVSISVRQEKTNQLPAAMPALDAVELERDLSIVDDELNLKARLRTANDSEQKIDGQTNISNTHIPTPFQDEIALEIQNSLVNPSQEEYNLAQQGPYWSQYGQDRQADEWLLHLENGFFIEAGGWNGEELSNTLYLERSRGWTGLLVEANPHLFEILVSKHRKCFAINAGVSMIKNQQEKAVFKFKLAGPLGGFVDTYSQPHLDRANTEIAQRQPWMAGVQGSGAEVDVATYPLHMILVEISHRRGVDSEGLKKIFPKLVMVVDFFSLDTEGSEAKILQAIDFDRIMFGLLVVEFNNDQNIREQLLSIMNEKGYKLVKQAGIDLWFGNPRYFQYRNLTWPQTG